MKPSHFDYVRPRTVAEATNALRSVNGSAKIIAGGQSLGPMLNLRLVQPSLLIDIAGMPELIEVRESGNALTIGAAITAADIEDGRVSAKVVPMLPRIAGGIAYRAVRNRGTIGGSLCHADPAADWVCTLAALGAVARIVGPDGATRSVPLQDFMLAAFENALSDAELLVAVTIPSVSAAARFGYTKISRKTGKFAMANGIVLHDPERQVFRAVMGATDGKPILIEDARTVFGDRPEATNIRMDEEQLVKLLLDNGVSGARAQHLHMTALKRAAEEAFAK
ncbi:carbon monoxide dehydrogenase [Mesorhizobium sp. B2-4-9]|uniref:FAD binding domain-containing protein n=1 Tax=Mesorhizobium sp. B2-4-9 TaxID=2589940 RepID=UPI00112D5840|nr:FAD binding domain-containing protein [Mesorhizobium sp. B2-4-9]TPL23455.1 carbon monoxide dehydrogenase [Mesorhizobium sp. B2-4-9]